MLQGVCLASCLCCVFRHDTSKADSVSRCFYSFAFGQGAEWTEHWLLFPPASPLLPAGCRDAARSHQVHHQWTTAGLLLHFRLSPVMGVTAAETSAILVPSFFSVTSSGITEFDYMGGKKKKKKPLGRTVLFLNFFCNFFKNCSCFVYCTYTRMHLMDSGAVGPWMRSLNITPNLTSSLKVRVTNQ